MSHLFLSGGLLGLRVFNAQWIFEKLNKRQRMLGGDALEAKSIGSSVTKQPLVIITITITAGAIYTATVTTTAGVNPHFPHTIL